MNIRSQQQDSTDPVMDSGQALDNICTATENWLQNNIYQYCTSKCFDTSY